MNNPTSTNSEAEFYQKTGVIHSLRNLLGLSATALFLTVCTNAHSQVLHHWTFEGANGTPGVDGTWWQDKVGTVDLTITTATAPTQQALPATGAGSVFPNPMPNTGAANEFGVDVSQGWFRNYQTNAFNGRDSFTVETFLNFANLTTGNQIFLQIREASNSQFQANVDGTTGTLRAVVYKPDGSFDSTQTSTLILSPNVDYYVGIVVSVGTQAENRFVTFYLKDLTNDGPLLTETISMAARTALTGLYQSNEMAIRIGESNQLAKMDEIRYANDILPSNQLLIIQNPGQGTVIMISSVSI